MFLSYITHLVHSQPPSRGSQEHSGLVNHLQSTFTGSQSKEKKMCFPTLSHLAEAKHFQGSLAETQAPSKAHCKEQAILLLPFTRLPVNSLVSAPSSHAGFQHLNSFHRLRRKRGLSKGPPCNAQCQLTLVPRTSPGPLGTEDAQLHDLSENTGAVAT